MSSPALAVRVCNIHGTPCTEDAKDRVFCPAGKHVVTEGKWSVRAGAAVAGDELVMAEARRALREQKRDPVSAREALIAAARLNPRLSRALHEDAAERAIARALGRVMAVPVEDVREDSPAPRRAVAVPPARPARSDSDRGLALMAASNLRNLLGQALTPGGPRLEELDRQALIEEAISSGGEARRGAIRARWLRLMAARMPAGRKVGQVFLEESVQHLHLQAEADLERVLDGLSKRLTTTRERHQLEGAK